MKDVAYVTYEVNKKLPQNINLWITFHTTTNKYLGTIWPFILILIIVNCELFFPFFEHFAKLTS